MYKKIATLNNFKCKKSKKPFSFIFNYQIFTAVFENIQKEEDNHMSYVFKSKYRFEMNKGIF